MFGTTARATLIVAAKDEASDTMARLAQQAKNGGEALEGMGRAGANAAKGGMLLNAANLAAAGGIAALGAAAAGAARESVNLAMQAEQNAVAFKTLLGSTTAAEAHLRELRDFAASTPFQFNDLVEASKKMQALGFNAKQVVPMLRDIGDAVAAMGGNSQMIDRVVMALGQMQAKGKASGEELLQMTEAGIPALKYMAAQAGVSTGEMQKLISKGLVPADQAIQAILAGMRQDFGGMMAEQAKTAAGALSNLEDAWTRVLTAYGKASTGIIKGTSDSTTAFLTMNAVVQEIANNPGLSGMTKWMMQWKVWSGWVTGNGVKAMQEVTDEMNNFAAATKAHNVDGLTDDLKENKQAFEDGSGSILDYKTSLTELYQKIDSTKMRMADLSTMMSGPLGKELEDNAEKTGDLRDRQAELKKELDKLTASNGKYWEHVEHSGASQAELTLTTLQLQKAQADLNEELGKSGDAYDPMKVAQLNVQIERLQGEITGATTVTSGYIDNSKKIGEVTTEYDEVTQAIKDQAAAHDEATKRIIWNILQQKLANLGLLEGPAGEALIELAHRWGLIDDATFLAMQGADQAIKDFLASGDPERFIASADLMANSVRNIPQTWTSKITIEEYRTSYNQAGGFGADSGSHGDYGSNGGSSGGYGGYQQPQPKPKPKPNDNQNYDGKNAFGGPVSAGGTYLWQESVFSRPEVFVPGTSGAVLTRQQAESMFGANGGSNGEIAAAIRSIPRVVAREIKTAVQFALVRGG